MTDAGFFKGTTAEQDSRFANVQKKMMKNMRFSDGISVKVDMSKVNLDIIKPWIAKRILEILDLDDDVVVDFTLNQLEERFPDPKLMQINLTGFLGGSSARTFMAELWELLDSAQRSEDGIPPLLIEMKKQLLEKNMVPDSVAIAQKTARRDRSASPKYKVEDPVKHPIPDHRRRFDRNRRKSRERIPIDVDSYRPHYSPQRRSSPPFRHRDHATPLSDRKYGPCREPSGRRNGSSLYKRRYEQFQFPQRREYHRKSTSNREQSRRRHDERIETEIEIGPEKHCHHVDIDKVLHDTLGSVSPKKQLSDDEGRASERRRKRKEKKKLKKEKKREKKRLKKEKKKKQMKKRNISESAASSDCDESSEASLREKAIKSMKKKRENSDSPTSERQHQRPDK